jgi:hypothetical protein
VASSASAALRNCDAMVTRALLDSSMALSAHKAPAVNTSQSVNSPMCCSSYGRLDHSYGQLDQHGQ